MVWATNRAQAGTRGTMTATPNFVRLPEIGWSWELSTKSSVVATLRTHRLLRLDRLLLECREVQPVTHKQLKNPVDQGLSSLVNLPKTGLHYILSTNSSNSTPKDIITAMEAELELSRIWLVVWEGLVNGLGGGRNYVKNLLRNPQDNKLDAKLFKIKFVIFLQLSY